MRWKRAEKSKKYLHLQNPHDIFTQYIGFEILIS